MKKRRGVPWASGRDESMRKISDERVGRQSHVENEVNEAELTSAQRGALQVARELPVFPCDPLSKRPLTKHGFKEASQEPQQVVKWWRKYPGALVGVPTGSTSGLIAVDVDPKGRTWFETEKARLGHYRLHGTRRGKHLLYRANGQAIRNSAGELADGVDVRGEGGYIVWWPAHGGISIGEPGELPKWLETELASSETNRAKVKLNGQGKSEEWPDEITEGGRNQWLSKRAYSLAKAGWGQEKILADLRALNAYYCKPPLSDSQLNNIVRGKRKFIDAQHNNPDTEVELIRADEQKEKPVDWLWKGFLARNKFHLLSGSGGVMKSTLTLSFAATITRGGHWPDGTRCPKGNVLIWTGEDDLADTVKPRLRYAGADQTRCWFVKGVREAEESRDFDPAKDAKALERACDQIGDVSLIVIDPVVVIVQKDNNSASDVRRSMQPLVALGSRYNAVILGLQHFTKGSKGKDPAERVLGSGAWVHQSRIVLAAAAIDEGEGKVATRMVFTCTKTFAKGAGGGFEYGFEEEPKTEIARIVWGKRLEGTGQHILAEAEGNGDGESKLGTAKRFLRELLSKGSVNVWEINKQAEAAHITGITLKRAKQSLKIQTLQAGKSSFRWALPEGDEN